MLWKFVAGLGAAFGLAAVSAAWAQSPPPPTGHWDLRQSGESCYLTRSFPNGSDSLELRIQSFGPSTPYHFVLIGNGLPIRKDRAVVARVGFEGAAPQDLIALAGNSGSLPAVVMEVTQSRVQNMLAWYYSGAPGNASLVGGFFPAAEELDIDFADTPQITLPLGPMRDEYARLGECAQAVVGKLRAASSPGGYPALGPQLLEQHTVNWRVKYPDNLVLNRISGLVEMRMTVDETGKVRDCVPQMTIWVPQFGVDACREMERWGKFKPAQDIHGKPVPALYRTAVMYVIYAR